MPGSASAAPAFLDEAEIERLTGRTRPTAQIRWLRDRGYAFDVNARGELVIARRHVEERLGAGGETERRKPEVDLSGLPR